MALPASDTFTAANGTALQTYNPSWSITIGSFVIQSNSVKTNSFATSSIARWNADVFSNDQYSQCTLAALTIDPGGVQVRVATNGTTNAYGAITDVDSIVEFHKWVAGVYTNMSSLPFMTAGNVIRIEAFGATLSVYRNGVQYGSTLTDSALASGTAGIGGFSSSNTFLDDWSAGNLTSSSAAPFFVAAGTGAESITTISPASPTHITNDIGLLFVESAGGEAVTLSTPAGFVEIANSPQATGAATAGTRLTVFWCRATSGAMTAPVVADPGDHVYGVILTFRGCPTTGNPWHVTAGSVKASASTTTTFPSVTTTLNNCLLVLAAARDTDSATAAWSAPVNAAIMNIQERFDLGTALGNGGGLVIYTAAYATPGSTGTTAATVASSINAQLTIAFAPPVLATPVTMTVTGSGTSSYIRIVGRVRPVTATGTVSYLRAVATIESTSSTATAAAVKSVQRISPVAATASPVMTASKQVARALSAVATGASAVVRNVARRLSLSGTGTAALVRSVAKPLSSSSTATATQARVRSLVSAMTVIATGVAVLAKSLVRSLIVS